MLAFCFEHRECLPLPIPPKSASGTDDDPQHVVMKPRHTRRCPTQQAPTKQGWPTQDMQEQILPRSESYLAKTSEQQPDSNLINCDRKLPQPPGRKPKREHRKRDIRRTQDAMCNTKTQKQLLQAKLATSNKLVLFMMAHAE